jgi:uncharacterized membrane protein (DUF2068 family)
MVEILSETFLLVIGYVKGASNSKIKILSHMILNASFVMIEKELSQIITLDGAITLVSTGCLKYGTLTSIIFKFQAK